MRNWTILISLLIAMQGLAQTEDVYLVRPNGAVSANQQL